MKFCHEILKLSCGENRKSLSQLVLKLYRVMTDRQTDAHNKSSWNDFLHSWMETDE